jgi:hypothetical protein
MESIDEARILAEKIIGTQPSADFITPAFTLHQLTSSQIISRQELIMELRQPSTKS